MAREFQRLAAFVVPPVKGGCQLADRGVTLVITPPLHFVQHLPFSGEAGEDRDS